MLRRAAASLAPHLLGGGASCSRATAATCGGGGLAGAGRPVTTSARVLDKKAGDSPDDAGAAARRAAAEKEAAAQVQRWSSPLFSHVEVPVDDRVIPRWANVVFVAAVFGVFGYCAQFAYNGESRKSQRKEDARLEREARAQSAIDSGALRDRRRNFAAQEDAAADPFDGMSPEVGLYKSNPVDP